MGLLHFRKSNWIVCACHEGREAKVQEGLLERLCRRVGVLASLPGSQFLEGSIAASIAGCQPGLPPGCHLPVLVRLCVLCI